MRRYVILEQTSIGVTVIARSAEGLWTVEVLTEGATLALPELAIEIPLADLMRAWRCLPHRAMAKTERALPKRCVAKALRL